MTKSIRFITLLITLACLSQSTFCLKKAEKEKEESEEVILAYDEKKPLKQLLMEHKGDFDADLFAESLTRPDINHVFLPEITSIISKLQKEFPDIITSGSIGQTW